MTRDEFSNKVSGTLLGMVVGDALGAPAREMTPYRARKNFQSMEAFYPYLGRAAGTYTSCAQIALKYANSMIGGKITHALLEEQLRQGPLKSLDPVTKRAKFRLDSGVPRAACAEKSTDSMWLERVVPVGILASARAMDPKEILRNCKEVSWPSHSHEVSSAFSCAIACVIKTCIMDSEGHSNPYEMFGADRSLMARVVGLLKSIDEHSNLNHGGEEPIWIKAQETWRMLQRKATPEEFVGYFGLRNECSDVVCLSLFLFMRHPGNMKSVQQAASLGGPSNITAALVGAMCGAYSGKFFLAHDMIDAVENSARLVAFCDMFSGKLFDGMTKEM